MEMHINDENFGIIPRDAEISEYILRCREKWGFPQNIFYYHDKRLTETTRRIALNLAPLSANGIAIPLQTENPEALINAKRKVVTPEKIAEVIGWAAEGGLQATTELIFGLPGETAETFCDSLDRALTRGFDSVLCNTLFIVDGIELNRAAERNRLNIKTRFRSVRDNYGMVEGNFCAEVEEVVVTTDTFDENDFLDIRKISMMFYACFNMRFHYWLISYLRYQGLSVTGIMLEFLNPELVEDEQGRAFALEFEKAARGELYDDAEKLRAELKKSYVANGNDVGDAAQLNILYGARLIYEEGAWVDEALMAVAARHLGEDAHEELAVCRFLIGLYRSERLDIKEMKTPASIEAHWDVLAWRKDKFKRPLSDYVLSDPQEIKFSVKPAFNAKFYWLREDFDIAEDSESYVHLLMNIGARSDLLFQMEYT